MNYLEKCVEIFDKNNRWELISLGCLKKFLRKEFQVKGLSNLKKSELVEIAKPYLTSGTLLSFCDVDNFGFLIKDIAETLEISKYMAKKFIEEKQIRCIGDYTFPKGYYRIKCNIYSIRDVITLGESGVIKPKKPKKIEEKTIEATPDNLAMALYVVNKSAKKSRDTKQNAYYERNFQVCNASKTRSRNLYHLKNATMEKMIQDGYMSFVGIHRQEIDEDIIYLDLYRCGNFTFHNIHCGYIDETKLLDNVIDDMISAEKTRKVPITYSQAVRLLEKYSGEKATGTYNSRSEWY